MAGIIAPSEAKSNGEIQRFIMDWKLRVAEKTQRARPRYCEGRTTQEDDDGRDGGTIHQEPNTYLGLERSRVAACLGDKMILQSHVPMDIGEEGEVEGIDDQICEDAA